MPAVRSRAFSSVPTRRGALYERRRDRSAVDGVSVPRRVRSRRNLFMCRDVASATSLVGGDPPRAREQAHVTNATLDMCDGLDDCRPLGRARSSLVSAPTAGAGGARSARMVDVWRTAYSRWRRLGVASAREVRRGRCPLSDDRRWRSFVGSWHPRQQLWVVVCGRGTAARWGSGSRAGRAGRGRSPPIGIWVSGYVRSQVCLQRLIRGCAQLLAPHIAALLTGFGGARAVAGRGWPLWREHQGWRDGQVERALGGRECLMGAAAEIGSTVLTCSGRRPFPPRPGATIRALSASTTSRAFGASGSQRPALPCSWRPGRATATACPCAPWPGGR
jgi:hypothetical protein